MSPWSDIALRAHKAGGGDRQLDLDIGLAAGLCRRLDADWITWDGDTYPDHPGSLYPAITESVDAVLDIIAETLPEWRVAEMRQLMQMRGGKRQTAGWSADLQQVNGSGYCEADAATPALALLAAFALAMEAQDGG